MKKYTARRNLMTRTGLSIIQHGIMENKATAQVQASEGAGCPERILEEIRETALAAAEMKGFLAGEKVIRMGLNSWPQLVDSEMARLKKAFCWNKLY